MKKRYLSAVLVFLTVPSLLYSREFLNSVLHLNFGGMYTFAATGDIIDSEKNAIDSSIPTNTNISHYETAYCVTLDIVPTDPVILGLEAHAIKFGIRGSYRFNFLQQRVTDEVELGDQVMDYRSWLIGPVIHYAPFIEPSDLNEDYSASGGFTIFALWGRVNGNMSAFPSLRERSITTGVYETKVTGYEYDLGIGAEIALCSLNFGINVYYSYTKLEMSDQIYSDLGKEGNLKEGCLEIYVGIPIESFIDPLIPTF